MIRDVANVAYAHECVFYPPSFYPIRTVPERICPARISNICNIGENGERDLPECDKTEPPILNTLPLRSTVCTKIDVI
jgi:hypothetical protein